MLCYPKATSCNYSSWRMGAAREAVAGPATIQVASYVFAGKDGQGLDLSLIGNIADQVAAASTSGRQLHLVFSGHADASAKAAKAVETLLSLKGQSGQVSAEVVEGEGQVALAAAQAKGSKFLLYLSHAPGVPDSSCKQVSPVSVYVPPSPGAKASCQPGQSVIDSAWAAAQAGVTVVLASAKERTVVQRVLSGEVVGTLFDTQAAVAAASTANGTSSSSHSSGCRDMAVRARAASRALQALPSSERVAMLHRVAAALEAHTEQILAENAKDVEEAKGKVAESLLQRLILKPAKISQLAAGIRAIADQPEPIGQLVRRMEVAEGLVLDKTTAPIGVLLIIFEARPDALPQIASLAIRSGNGLLLKGGKEAARSNAILHRIIVEAVGPMGPDLIGLVTTREEISDLLALDDVIDLVIPRGGNALVSHIQRSTRIPVLGHADGICHAYIDAAANLEMAKKIVVDAKTDYPAACNAIEKVLVHSHWTSAPGPGPSSGLVALYQALTEAGVTVHTDDARVKQVCGSSLPSPPSARHEYSSMDVTLQVVDSMDEAIEHIHGHGSAHTEVVVTEDPTVAAAFLARVDAACVFHNASTRFSDGFRFGLGAEVGISTSRIHARGPVGVEGLLTTKWVMRGNGQVVAKDKGVNYVHKLLPLQ